MYRHAWKVIGIDINIVVTVKCIYLVFSVPWSSWLIKKSIH